MKTNLVIRAKHFFVAALLLCTAMVGMSAGAGTIVNGTQQVVNVKILGTATRPDGFYIYVDKSVDPGGLVVQNTTAPASCANTWLMVIKDGYIDSKIYRDMVNSIQFAIALKKNVNVIVSACNKNVELTSPTANGSNYPILFGIDTFF